jgi:hypothetical protein
MGTELHFAEDALALHLLLQRLEGLIDIVVADDDLQALTSFPAFLKKEPQPTHGCGTMAGTIASSDSLVKKEVISMGKN